jgi:hypothetical protein
MARNLTISALIDRCAPFSEAERAHWTRRARHWAMASQVLPKAPKTRRGSGRHRRYRTEDVYLMAVMFRLSDSTLPIGTLNAISELIQDWVNDPCWEAAKLGSTDRAVFLSIIFSDEEPLVDTHFGPLPEFEEDHDGPIILLNVSLIFERLRSQEAGHNAP